MLCALHGRWPDLGKHMLLLHLLALSDGAVGPVLLRLLVSGRLCLAGLRVCRTRHAPQCLRPGPGFRLLACRVFS